LRLKKSNLAQFAAETSQAEETSAKQHCSCATIWNSGLGIRECEREISMSTTRWVADGEAPTASGIVRCCGSTCD
jgi:hypothetical protein